ncbi:MAG: DNA internalization-related competence protein ComEC/Rec2 [Melioribacteraceae bacterium]|nr:DNA internalization-related competence protein ComEC/Rec2 [Melioribacteraceae bacterium]
MRDYPLIKFTILFALGILISRFIEIEETAILYITAPILVLSSIVFFKKNHGIISTSIMILLIICLGFLSSRYTVYSDGNYPFKKLKITKSTMWGKLRSVELARENHIAFLIECDSVRNNSITYATNGIYLAKLYDKNFSRLKNKYEYLAIGNTVEIKGTISKGREERNPGEFDYNKYLKSIGVSGLINAYKSSDLKILDDDQENFPNIIFSLRKSIDSKFKELYSNEAALLLRGLILADRSEIDYETREKFINSGVIHVLAVSGLHVGYIILIFLFVFGRMNIYLKYILTITGLLFFVILTGSPPSVFRASVMAIILIISEWSNRNYNVFNSLAIAALILLMLNPNELFNPGFQLSFSAVLSILIIYPRFKTFIDNSILKNKLIKSVLLFASVSLAAQIGTLPFTLMYFHKLSIISLFANLIVIPLIGFIVGLGIATIILTYLSFWLASVFAASNQLFIDILYTIVNFSGGLSFSYLYIPQFSYLDMIIFYVFISILFLVKTQNLVPKSLIIILAVFNIIIFASLDDVKLLKDNELTVFMIDVGQGDGILIQFPDGTIGLIDAGDASQNFDNGMRTIYPLMRTLSIKKIDIGFVSHLDSDHYKGFESLIRNNLVDKIIKPEVDSTLKKDIEFENLIKEHNVPFEYYSHSSFVLGNAKIYFLNDTSDAEYDLLDSNDKSGIIKIVHGDNTFLFVGDVEKKAEKLLVRNYSGFLHSDVLKVGHHGSRTSSTVEFLEKVSPKFALISAGIENKFNHPAPDVVDRYEGIGASMLRTDISGAIVLQSDGKEIKMIDWRNL